MKFINALPLQYKFKLIEEIEKRQIHQFDIKNANRMTQFLKAWKNSGASGQFVDSCVYPEAFISDKEKQL